MSLKKLLSIVISVILFSVIGWFIITFIIVPVVSVISEIFFTNGQFSLESIKKLAASQRVKNALVNSFVMAFFTIITVSVVGFFQILVTEYFKIKGAKLLNAAFMTPLLFSGISLVRGYNFVYSSTGFITNSLLHIFPNMNPYWFTGFVGVLFVHSFSFTTYHILFVKTAFKRIDYSTIEAAKSLGASNLTAFFKVALPVIKPSVFSATILVVLGALGSFAAPSMLGGRDFYMINSMIQNLNSIKSYDMAALLSFILSAVCIFLLVLMKWLEKKSSYISVSKVPTKIRKIKIKNPLVNGIVHIVSYALFFVYIIPVAAVVIFSMADIKSITMGTLPNTLTLEHYFRGLSNPVVLRPFVNSIQLSLYAIAMILPICVISSLAIHRKPGKATAVLEYSFMIPWVLPATMIVVGMITSFATPNLLVFGATLLGSYWLLPIAYAVNSLPSNMRLIRASLYSVNQSHEEAARSLGASAVYTFVKVVLPAILPTAVSVGAICFNGLLSEYTMSALLYNVNNFPLGIMLRSPELVPDPYGPANNLVFIVVLMVISGTTLFLTRKYRNVQ